MHLCLKRPESADTAREPAGVSVTESGSSGAVSGPGVLNRYAMIRSSIW